MTKTISINIPNTGLRFILSAFMVIVLGLCAAVALGLENSAQAQIDVFQQCDPAANGVPGPTAGTTQVCQATGTSALFGGGSIWAGIIRIITVVIGAVSVLMIVIGGLRYTMSGGDSSQTKGAKDTILYALVGLVISIIANTIVNFVINNI